MNAWLWLAIAIAFEVSGTMSLKLSTGLTKTLPSILTAVFYLISFSALSIALKKLEVGVAYAIWSGVGTACIATLGILFLGESISTIKIIGILSIIVGAIILNIANNVH